SDISRYRPEPTDSSADRAPWPRSPTTPPSTSPANQLGYRSRLRGSTNRLWSSNRRPLRPASPARRPAAHANEFSWTLTFHVPRLQPCLRPHLAVRPLLRFLGHRGAPG